MNEYDRYRKMEQYARRQRFVKIVFGAGALLACVVVGMRHAHSQTPTPILASEGLGTGGFAQAGTLTTRTIPSGRVWVITGTDPDTEIEVTLQLAAIEGPNAAGTHTRANCTVTVSRTQPDYSWGMNTPLWPAGTFLQWSAYDLVAGTKTLHISVPFPGLQPSSNYSFDFGCWPR